MRTGEPKNQADAKQPFTRILKKSKKFKTTKTITVNTVTPIKTKWYGFTIF